jgi:hypothetical protein
MRFETKVMAALVMVPAVLTQTPALCPTIILGGPPNIRGTAGGGTNCGFFTIEQCRATVSGIGGFCVPNQFYNPCGSAGRRSSRYRY